MLEELNTRDLCVRTPDLFQWGDDLIPADSSVPADSSDELFVREFTGVSESDDARARATSKDKFTSSNVADKSYLCDFKIIPPSRKCDKNQPSAITESGHQSKLKNVCLSVIN